MIRRASLAFVCLSIALVAPASTRAADEGRADAPVTIVEDDAGFTLANGQLTARIDKRSGTFTLKLGDLDVIERGYWSQVGRSGAGDIARFGLQRSNAVRTDPKTNNGERAEVSCRFGYDGKSPGLPCDVDLHFALARGDRALYTWGIWEHKPGSPNFSVGEARTAYKLNPRAFDYLYIDDRRHELLPSGKDWDAGEQLNMKEVRRIRTGPFAGRVEHKYDYSAILADTPAYGWCGTRDRVGCWLINPSIEYLAGGPTKVELTAHLDVNTGGAPTLLNMWHGSHYGGSSLAVGQQEAWTKLVGPFLVYCNRGDSPDAMHEDALARAKAEQAAWPYRWVNDPQYPQAEARGTATGTLTVTDPLAPKLTVSHLRVGLAAAPYSAEAGGRNSPLVDWQRDSKHYQFWTEADIDGRFTIPNVRPGRYTLYAFADGFLGEFRHPNVIVTAGQKLDLGQLTWRPVRRGRQVWEIGVPDRTAGEFRHGDNYWHWGLYYDYAKEFPNDVNFVIGQSDWRKDWNYCQPPRIEGNRVTPTTWSITFDLPEAPRPGARATLRLAFAGSRGRGGVEVTANDHAAGNTDPLPDTGVMHRDGIRGYWFEREVPFDAGLLKQGRNVLKLRVPATSWVDGVLYDYLRLELENGPAASEEQPKQGASAQ